MVQPLIYHQATSQFAGGGGVNGCAVILQIMTFRGQSDMGSWLSKLNRSNSSQQVASEAIRGDQRHVEQNTFANQLFSFFWLHSSDSRQLSPDIILTLREQNFIGRQLPACFIRESRMCVDITFVFMPMPQHGRGREKLQFLPAAKTCRLMHRWSMGPLPLVCYDVKGS